MPIPTDAMLADIQHRRDVAEEERRIWLEETANDDDVPWYTDEAEADSAMTPEPWED